ncbi:MAG: TatD family deoxyribonuclease [Mesorhizobium sp.]|uniref:Qat anti-phage system TatD family nuclease QatD n=1 Tax=unclassified Mesorhizobium TaxID=325217 RepID=UPI000F7616B6|nr:MULTISPECIES: Qat anti-phage system TatD family nuclease QatD [unclassified Mesorhizobium]AZO19697.1 TatD family deoxyribonuclease [Mesorhizobium sp. M1E.F.Ca.ET.045.02.1.1]RWB63992.1 MAG: TatD family deoxyribonuclease [Mesorhizobium sp.]TGQ44674.1 TatD family deoxyribonuclease [Mesorhizobium sp. M00.F.Ca.ET.216.01.1.1]TIU27872.1 MAG: TatD family deoxyribonuclease [Mesorhizobium sp.]
MSAPRLVDFHSHLDLYPDPAAAIRACEEAKVATLAVTTTPKAFRQNMNLAKGAEFVRIGLGIHPHLAEQRWTELPLFEALLPETRYVGEVGLDASPAHYRSIDRQVDVFRRILTSCQRAGDKILSVHSVRTASKVLDHIEELLPKGSGKVVLHWFSGSVADARRAAALGCYFSVNQAMFRSERSVALLGTLPLDRLLTETDGPFVEVDGSPVTPGGVDEAVRMLGDVVGLGAEEMRRAILNNLKAVLERSAN